LDFPGAAFFGGWIVLPLLGSNHDRRKPYLKVIHQTALKRDVSAPENLMSNPSISLNNARTGFVIVADAMITFNMIGLKYL
jgi:hypothetical protein